MSHVAKDVFLISNSSYFEIQYSAFDILLFKNQATLRPSAHPGVPWLLTSACGLRPSATRLPFFTTAVPPSKG